MGLFRIAILAKSHTEKKTLEIQFLKKKYLKILWKHLFLFLLWWDSLIGKNWNFYFP